MLLRWRAITIIGIRIAADKSGQSCEKCQFCFTAMVMIKVRGKDIEAIIDAREMYRQMRTAHAHIAKAAAAGMMK